MLVSRVVKDGKVVVARRLGEETAVEALVREATKEYENVQVVTTDSVQGFVVIQCVADNHDRNGKMGLYIELDGINEIEVVTAYCSISEIERASEDIIKFIEPMINML